MPCTCNAGSSQRKCCLHRICNTTWVLIGLVTLSVCAADLLQSVVWPCRGPAWWMGGLSSCINGYCGAHQGNCSASCTSPGPLSCPLPYSPCTIAQACQAHCRLPYHHIYPMRRSGFWCSPATDHQPTPQNRRLMNVSANLSQHADPQDRAIEVSQGVTHSIAGQQRLSPSPYQAPCGGH